MDCNLNTLVSMVKVVMDRNMDSTPLETIGDVDTLAVNDIIKQAIPNAARIVEQAAPFHLLGRGEPFSGTVYWPGEIGVGSGHIQLPDDFLRLVCFQMSDWVMPARQSIIFATSRPISGNGSTIFDSGNGAAKNSRHSSGLMAIFAVRSACGIFTLPQGFVLMRMQLLS